MFYDRKYVWTSLGHPSSFKTLKTSGPAQHDSKSSVDQHSGSHNISKPVTDSLNRDKICESPSALAAFTENAPAPMAYAGLAGDDKTPAPMYMLIPRGVLCEAHFPGEGCKFINNCVGAQRFHHLLRTGKATASELATYFGTPLFKPSQQEVLDQLGVKRIRDRLEELTEMEEQCKSLHHELAAEKERLEAELLASIRPNGKSKVMRAGDCIHRTYDTVRKSIERFFKRIKELGMLELHQHLKASTYFVKAEYRFEYAPIRPIPWVLDDERYH